MSETLSASSDAFLVTFTNDVQDLDQALPLKELDVEDFQSKDGCISMTPQRPLPDSSDNNAEATLARQTLRENAARTFRVKFEA